MILLEQLYNSYLEKLREDKDRKEKNCFYVTDLSKCLRGVFLERQGKAPDEELEDRVKRIFRVGQVFEEEILKACNGDIKFETQGSLVWKDEEGKDVMRGRYDLLFLGDNPHVVEVKTMHSQGFHWRAKSGWTPLPAHFDQLTLYLGKLKETIPNISGSLLYISKDDLCLKQIPVPFDENHYNYLMIKFANLESCWRGNQLPEMPEPVVFDIQKRKWVLNWVADYCSHHDQCTGDPDWRVKAKKIILEKNKQTYD